jgi:hypothetical protein
MNKLYRFSLKALALAAISFVATPAQAQLGNIGDLLKAGQADANTLAEAYVAPLANGFGAGLNSGWFMGANTHGGFFPIPLPGFSVQARVSITNIPSADKTIDLTALNFVAVSLDPTQSSTTPSIAGGDATGARLLSNETVTFGGQTRPLFQFSLPKGTGVPFVPTIMVQAGVGLIFDTDITLRYSPKTDFNNYGSVQLLGASVRHGLDQWIPGGSLLPVNITLQAGFTNLKSSVNISLSPSDLGATAREIQEAGFSGTFFDDQKLEWETSAYTVNVLVGKKISLLVIGIGAYVGAGIESSTTTLATLGNYPFFDGLLTETIAGQEVPVLDGITPVRKLTSVPDVLDLEFKGTNSFRGVAGLRFSLGIFDFFGEYVMAKYPTFNGGVAISFRS